MKTRLRIYIMSILCALAVLFSGQMAFAQKAKGALKYVPEAVTKKTVPYAVNPKLSPAARQWVTDFSGVEVERAMVRATAAQRAEVSTLAAQRKESAQVPAREKTSSAAQLKVPDFTLPELPGLSENMGTEGSGPDVEIEGSGINLTGLQTLQLYFPEWRQELKGMFREEQLDAVEAAIQAADEEMFVLGEDGELQIRNPDEWNYQARFLTILKTLNAHFTEKKIKQLMGRIDGKQLTFSDYLTLQNAITFIIAKGKLPRLDIIKNGKRCARAQLEQQAEDGNVQVRQLLEEVRLGRRLQYAKRTWPHNMPIWKTLTTLLSNPQYLNRARGKSPEEWLSIIGPWVEEHGRWPSAANNEKEKQMYMGAEGAIRRYGDNPASVKLKELKEQYEHRFPYKTPEKWLSLIIQWTSEHQRWPSCLNPEENSLCAGANNVIRNHPNNPASVALKELKEKYLGPRATYKTPQEWLKIIRSWVEEHGRWPSYFLEEEKFMYDAANNVFRQHPNDPVTIELRKLKEQYGKK